MSKLISKLIEVSCVHCGYLFYISEKKISRQFRCPNCGKKQK